jgi:very-short-patch-repair endonuclease
MRGPNEKSTTRARALRRAGTAAENILWSHLRNRQLDGHKFTRQEPIGPFIADFCCRAQGLVIEIDGPTHDTIEAQMHDMKRSAFLAAHGHRVIRFRNEQIRGELSSVLDAIRAALN